MTAWNKGLGGVQHARLGIFGVSIEPAAIGYRADLYTWSKGANSHIVPVGFYNTLADAEARAMVDAQAIISGCAPCACGYVMPCNAHREDRGARDFRRSMRKEGA